jgi:membrane protein implicated in regulation of membrane protease activity
MSIGQLWNFGMISSLLHIAVGRPVVGKFALWQDLTLVAALVVVQYYLLARRKALTRTMREFRSETSSQRLLGNIFLVVYFVGSYLLFVAVGYTAWHRPA